MPSDSLAAEPGLRDVAAVVAGVSAAGVRSVAARGHDNPDSRTPFRIASLSKVFTATALVRALGDAGIPPATRAVDLLPGLATDWRGDRAVTVEHVLAQVAGLREVVDAASVAALGDGPDAVREAARLVARGGSERAPGERWSYYNGNYFLAGALLAAVTELSYEDAVHRLLLDPWRLTGTGFEPAEGYPHGRRPSGGLWSSVADLLTTGEQLLMDRRLLDQIRARRTRSDDPMAYGLGWALGPSGQMYLNGRLPGHRAALLMLPDHDYVAVVVAADEQSLPALARILDRLQRPMTGDHLAEAVNAFAA